MCNTVKFMCPMNTIDVCSTSRKGIEYSNFKVFFKMVYMYLQIAIPYHQNSCVNLHTKIHFLHFMYQLLFCSCTVKNILHILLKKEKVKETNYAS